MYKPKFFAVQEVVGPQTYAARGAAALQLVDDRVLRTLDQLREKFGPLVVNTWHSPTLVSAYGKRTESGLRDMDTATGAGYSQHKFGRAADCIFKSVSADEVRKYVLSHVDEFEHITCIEDKVRWFHFDVRNCNRILVVQP